MPTRAVAVEERYRTLVDTVREIICTVTPDSRFTSFNPAFHALTGWTDEEWMGRPFAGLVHPDDLPACVAAFETALRGELGPSVRHRLLMRAGAWLAVESTAAPLFRDGRVIEVLGLVRDVTDRVKAEEDLRRSRRRLEEAEEVAHIGSWEWNVATDELTWTAELYRLFGVTPAEFRPTYESSLQLIHPDDRSFVDDICQSAVREGRDYAWDARLVRPNGEARFLHARGHAVRDASGTVRRMIGIAQDITERKQHEQVRRDLLLRLITSHEKERARLSRELHDGTGQALAALLVGLRHLEDARSLAAVRLAVGRQREIVAQTLDDIGRVARGLRPTVLDDVGLRAALERHVADQAWLFGFRVSFDASALGRRRLPHEVETALYRAAQEALANAGQHANASWVRIVLQLDRQTVRLSVADDGCGFDVARAMAAGGHLGLFTIRERAELLGGRAKIDSSPDEGTTVSLAIPLPPAFGRKAARRREPRARSG